MKATVMILDELEPTQEDFNRALIDYIDRIEDRMDEQEQRIARLENVVGYHQDVNQHTNETLSKLNKTYELLAG